MAKSAKWAKATKRDFELVARLIRQRTEGVNDQAVQDVLKDLASDFAMEFAGINPRFDRSRFLTACGVEKAS